MGQGRAGFAERMELGPRPDAMVRPPTLGQLAEAFDLSELETSLLLLAAAPGLDRGLARLYSFAWADFTVKVPTAGFLGELVADTAQQFAAAMVALRADGRLARHRLIRLTPAEQWPPGGPLLHRGVVVPEPVLARLRGESPCLEDDARAAVAFARPSPWPMWITPELRRQIERFWVPGAQAPQPILSLAGEPGSGRLRALAAASAALNRPLLVVDCALVASTRWQNVLGEAAREARFEGAGLLVRADEAIEREPEALVAALRIAMESVSALGVSTPRPGALRRTGLALRSVVFPALSAMARAQVWAHAVGDLDDAATQRLAQRFAVSPGAIERAADEVQQRRAIADDQAASEQLCAEVLEERAEHALDALADQVMTTLDWHDVVLAPDVRVALEEIRAQAKHRALVFDHWGFRRKLDYGRGLACLFSGPPGTGKTMMAGILARDLGLPMYRVDLSRVVSKWVGETEKNLSHVFDEAEKAHAILFFDEADSLFATRTEVRGANDRFANMEVNYLLQRMERFDGVSILTTNFERSIDDAFKRRLRFRVHFPLPEVAERTELWARMVPAEMEVDDGIRWDQLAQRYKFSGGGIKSAVLRAAFYAADEGGVLTHGLLERAAEAERREMGRL
ncbi:MAG: ATP-binding protein [Myxococcales bacterium]|nr:ATP-binding protein [Myxococcales bacterium]